MLPKLPAPHTVSELIVKFISALKIEGFRGDCESSYGKLMVGSTDNSIYQVMPDLLCFPKDSADVQKIARVACQEPFVEIKLTARGGGTGTNGQSLNKGVVVDTSRYMNRILEYNLDEMWIDVEPGVVLDQLNASIREDDVFFAPDLSPSSRATIGGMVSTDACGKGSRIYGKTSDHLLSIDLVLANGSRYTSRTFSEQEIAEMSASEDHGDRAMVTACSICKSHRREVLDQFPKLRRFLSGYNLKSVCDKEGEFQANYLLAGSEGTLALITKIRLRLTPLPKHKTLFLTKYKSFNAGLADAGNLLASEPLAIETIDDTILNLARGDVIWSKVGQFFSEPGDENVAAVNLVEFIADTEPELNEKCRSFIETLKKRDHKDQCGFAKAETNEDIQALWSLRKKGVGLLGNRPGSRRPIAFVEDTVVPPEQLADYIKEFRSLLDSHGLNYGMFGHVDVGCLHVRPALDLKMENDEKLIRSLSDGVKDLVKRYGGVIWGEHGKGFRSEFVPEFFGPNLYKQMRVIKKAFDPAGKLNPGKICAPEDLDLPIPKLDEVPMRGQFDRQITPKLQETFDVSLRCNGNGACFQYDADELMCPSYKLTKEKIHSPKGRAGLLREWARLASSPDETSQNKVVSSDQDFSQEVYDALDGCLACKACSHTCPIKVDIPEQKARFLNSYYTRYKRPVSDKLFASGETIHKRFVQIPWVYNFSLMLPGFRSMMKKLGGIVDPPKLSQPSYLSLLRKQDIQEITKDQLRDSSFSLKDTVVLLPDAITAFYEAGVFVDCAILLKKLGFRIAVAPFVENGKALHVKGFLEEFKQVAKTNTEQLRLIEGKGARLVGVDPALTLCLREEYPRYVEGSVPKVQLLSEFLIEHKQKLLSYQSDIDKKTVRLLGHCGERASLPKSDRDWQEIFAAFGVELKAEKVGCCGMAGAYGHESRHFEDSKTIFSQSWRKKLEDSNEVVVASGASCRSQCHRFSFEVEHPLSFLNRLVVAGKS